MKNHTVQLLVMLCLGIAIGAIGAYLAGQGGAELTDNDEYSEEVSTSTMEEGVGPKSEEPSVVSAVDLPGKDRVAANTRPGLVVSDQPAGTEVLVSGFSFDAPQWVAIYDDRGGKPGWILGAKRFLPGDSSGIVPLLRATVSGETYYAVVHGDDGDLEFDKVKDPAPAPDSALMVTFKAR
jgi:hypothetical protein